MKKFIFVIGIIFSLKSEAQNVHLIKIIHAGAELKPVGTLIICVEKLILPQEKRMDSLFGKGVQTDMRTFNIINNYVKKTTYKKNPYPASFDNGFFKIVDGDDNIKIIRERDMTEFFGGLKKTLKKKKGDKNVLYELRRFPGKN